MKTIAVVGTFDSKGEEYAFVRELIEKQGVRTLMIHTGVFPPTIKAHIGNDVVAAAAGENIEEVAAKKDRAYATEVLAKGMEKLIPQLYAQGEFDGILSFGGSGGTAIATPGMRALPVGVPKIMVSTVASGDVSVFVGTSDIMMYPSIVDVSGINTLSEKIFSNAVNAMVGMVTAKEETHIHKKPLIAATMFGVTTPCIDMAREYLEEHGYEVLVFHATGIGGRTMESLIRSGFFAGVLDLTTTEWCDELVGGTLAAGPHRLEAAGEKGIPRVVSVGAMDMVNFGPVESVPEKFRGRNLYRHNPAVTLMRTNIEENKELGKILAEKMNMGCGNATLMLPLGGVSMIDAPGQPFYGEKEDAALFEAIHRYLDPWKTELLEIACNINEEAFAKEAARKLIQLIEDR
ncbi:MAG: Tm-1-like ATP-binding domain-containing protein [Christensenella sp.]|nr:Tm-1-like ATP-binding domain-containing protein [Christensenella sp.]